MWADIVQLEDSDNADRGFDSEYLLWTDPGSSDSFRFVYLGVAVETGLIRLFKRGIQKLKVSVTD